MKEYKSLLGTFLLFLTLLTFEQVSYSALGVGVGTGKIQIDKALKPGTIYELPQLIVMNTGDEEAEYQIDVAYHEKQPQIMPPKEWFEFSPETFTLKPTEVKNVDIKLNIPIKTTPGEYFAYLEAHPLKKATTGEGTSVGIAAAAKLYFTVAPANFFEGVYYRIVSFLKINQPWTNRVLVSIAVIGALLTFKKYFRIELNVKKPEQGDKEQNA